MKKIIPFVLLVVFVCSLLSCTSSREKAVKDIRKSQLDICKMMEMNQKGLDMFIDHLSPMVDKGSLYILTRLKDELDKQKKKIDELKSSVKPLKDLMAMPEEDVGYVFLRWQWDCESVTANLKMIFEKVSVISSEEIRKREKLLEDLKSAITI